MSRHMFGARDERGISENLFDSACNACFHSLGRITVRRKKRRHCNFTCNQNPAFSHKGVSAVSDSGAVLNMKSCLPGTLLFTLLRNTLEEDVWHPGQKSVSGRKKQVRVAEKDSCTFALVTAR